jgi:hypothetical protein
MKPVLRLNAVVLAVVSILLTACHGDSTISLAITASPASISMVAGSGVSTTITVTNTSALLTATNITADLSGTPLQGVVTQDASACTNVAPLASCILYFTPMNTAVTLTHFPIRGSNTGLAGGAIEITMPTSAMITVTGSPLLLQGTNGTPAPGTVTVTNTSTLVTAVGITADLTGTALNGYVVEDSSNCASVAPGSSCLLTFTPQDTAVASTSVVIQGSNTSQVGASIAVNAAPQVSLLITGSPLSLNAGGSAQSITVTNQSSTETATNIHSNFTGTALAGQVTESANTCTSVVPSASCTLTYTPGSNSVAQTAFSVAGDNTQTASAAIAILVPTTTLATSVSSLALAVSGTPRTITITNTGSATAVSVGHTLSPALPTGTTISPASCGNIAAAGTCVLTVTPGATPSAATGDTTPIAAVATIAGTNTNTLTPSINILGYGSVYQSGYVFSIDDTTPNTGGIGGEVAALTDQAASSGGVIWSSDSSGAVNYSIIYGVDQTSTLASPSPSSGQVSGQLACNGALDGACDTVNILAYYSPPTTSPAVNLSYYAAGLCAGTIGGFSDWHLPAVCEMGYDTANYGSGCGSAGSPTIQNMQSNLVDNGDIGGLVGPYWVSTEVSSNPINLAFYQYFATAGGSYQLSTIKANQLGVRCARAITN